MRAGERWWDNAECTMNAFSWDLWYGCNYRCSYCYWEMDGLWETLARENKPLPNDAWFEAWRKIHDLHGPARISLVGGEPTLYPGSQELFAGLTRWHFVDVTTNLSQPLSYFEELIARVDRDRIHFCVSFHPQFADWGQFLAKVLFLRDSGLRPDVVAVAWPPHLPRLDSWQSDAFKHGFRLGVEIFEGRFEGRPYPASYTPEEQSRLSITLPSQLEIDYRLQKRKTRGKLCGTGHVYVKVKPNGDVFRCEQDHSSGRPMGNLLRGDFALDSGPQACDYDSCTCGEFNFLWESWSKRLPAASGGAHV